MTSALNSSFKGHRCVEVSDGQHPPARHPVPAHRWRYGRSGPRAEGLPVRFA